MPSLRITAQLVEAQSGAHIWADRFEGGVSEIFDLQDRITESDMLRIEPQLTVEKIRWRLRHMDESVLRPFVEALHAAGLPGNPGAIPKGDVKV